jgi:FkbM family methyltransferase
MRQFVVLAIVAVSALYAFVVSVRFVQVQLQFAESAAQVTRLTTRAAEREAQLRAQDDRILNLTNQVAELTATLERRTTELSNVAKTVDMSGSSVAKLRKGTASSFDAFGMPGDVARNFTRRSVPEVCSECEFFYAEQDVGHSASFIEQFEVLFRRQLATSLYDQREKGCGLIDIGSNGGYYSLMAASIGCATIALDAQPRCLQRLASSAAVSGFGDMTLIWSAIQRPGAKPISVGATKCSGLWSANLNSTWINEESGFSVDAPSKTLAEVLAAAPRDFPFTAMKIDIEGGEVEVLKQALPLLIQPRKLQHIFVEVWSQEGSIEIFSQILAAGYDIYKANQPGVQMSEADVRFCLSIEGGRGCEDFHIIRREPGQ